MKDLEEDIIQAILDNDLLKIDEDTTNLQMLRNNTFDYNDEQEHFMGSHWDSIYEEDKFQSILGEVLSLLDKSILLEGYKDEDLSFGRDESWEVGFTQIIPPNDEQGFCIVQKIEKEKSEIQVISMFPYFNCGQEYDLNLDKIFVWGNGLEGQIEVDLGFTSIVFYDTHFNTHKEYYLKDRKYKFKIFGVCYQCGIPIENEIQVDMKPEVLESMGKDPNNTLQTFSLEGMTSFFQISEWDRDDYSFRGVIEEVFDTETTFGNKGWILRTKVLRSGFEEDIEYSIDMLVTDMIWKEERAPQVGDNIDGSVWLQGRMIEPFKDTKNSYSVNQSTK